MCANATKVNETVIVKITGDSCPFGEIWNGTACSPPNIVLANGTVRDIVVTTSVPHFFKVSIPIFTPNFHLSVTSTLKAGEVEVYGRYGANPSKTVYDVKSDPLHNIQVPMPKTGDWFFVIYNTNTNGTVASVTLNTESTKCNNSFVGPSCSSPIENITTSLASPQFLSSKSLSPKSWYYFAVPTTVGTNPLWVSVAPRSSSYIPPVVYVSAGTLPYSNVNGYDIMGCNVDGGCGFATIINLNNTKTGNYTFYVGVYCQNATEFGIWFSSTCPSGCENSDETGSCTYGGANQGQCICSEGYSALDCKTSDGTLPAQYIVLIIIASLVVASAIIGFIAWAYMQKKRDGYSSLK